MDSFRVAIESRESISSWWNLGCSPSPSSSETAVCPRDLFRAVNMTSPPNSLHILRTIASPIPLLDPVTIATLAAWAITVESLVDSNEVITWDSRCYSLAIAAIIRCYQMLLTAVTRALAHVL